MEFAVGQNLYVDGGIYNIIGSIRYRNQADGECWMEYRLIQNSTGGEYWLSCDDAYEEYSISCAAPGASISGYHQVDQGTEEVVGCWGQVDVSIGDRATFCEYEDSTEEKIISMETWDDGREVSQGYYLDGNEFYLYSGGSTGGTVGNGQYSASYTTYSGGAGMGGTKSSQKSKNGSIMGVLVLIFVVVFGVIPAILDSGIAELFISKTTIKDYLEKTSSFTYVTSMTGSHEQKADVYEAKSSLDSAVKMILDAVEGNVENVQQNTEDGDQSVAILTEKENCLVYIAKDGRVLVQVSSRAYSFYNDNAPYECDDYTHRYYRRHYYSRGYFSDRSHYNDYSSPYDSFSDDTIHTNPADQYHTYSESVRQSSIHSRRSSGGGTGFGK